MNASVEETDLMRGGEEIESYQSRISRSSKPSNDEDDKLQNLASTVISPVPVTIAQSRRSAILSLPQTPPTWGGGMHGFTKGRYGDKVGGDRAGCLLGEMYLSS
jgi:hypothetical protein